MQVILDTAVFEQLSLAEMARRAQELGFDGLEIVAPHGQLAGGVLATLAADPVGSRDLLKEYSQTLAVINAGTFAVHAQSALQGSVQRAMQAVDLAAAVACPLVVFKALGDARGPGQAQLLSAYTEGLQQAASYAAQRGVSIAIENTGVLARTHNLWHVHDAVGLPTCRVCIDPARSVAAGDSPSFVLLRLAGGLGMVRFTELELDAGDEEPFVPKVSPSNPTYIVELLRGLAYRGPVCISAPADTTADDCGDYLKRAAEVVRREIERPQVVLSAYKGDKNAPKFASPDRRAG